MSSGSCLQTIPTKLAHLKCSHVTTYLGISPNTRIFEQGQWSHIIKVVTENFFQYGHDDFQYGVDRSDLES